MSDKPKDEQPSLTNGAAAPPPPPNGDHHMPKTVAYLDTAHPITAAVLPQKQDAFARAEQDARALAGKYLAKMEEHGMDLDTAFPRGNATMDARHNLATRLTTYTAATRRWGEPNIRAHKPENVEAFVAEMIKGAGDQYDLFVMKIVNKIGEVVDASLTGSHVWGYSTLTVTKADGSVERWTTMQIVNTSKLGTLFNQWPTRKAKAPVQETPVRAAA